MKKVYINNFREELNDIEAIIYIDKEINFKELYEKMKEDKIAHLDRFEWVKKSGMFCIEDCNLVEVTIYSVEAILNIGYAILQLRKDSVGFYIKVPDLL